jgi:hypothetical protein
MTPINFLNFSLIIHTLFKRQRSMENFRVRAASRRYPRERNHGQKNADRANCKTDQEAWFWRPAVGRTIVLHGGSSVKGGDDA